MYGERESQSIIDITADERESIQAKVEAVRKLYTKHEDWGSVIKVETPDGGFERVKRAEFESEWQPIAPPALPGGSNDSVSFLGSDQANDTDSQGDTALPALEVSQFPTEDAAAGLDADTTVRESDAEALTLEQRVARLEAKVFAKVTEAAA